MTAFPCILYQRLQVRLDKHFCDVHAVADMLRGVCLTCLRLGYAVPCVWCVGLHLRGRVHKPYQSSRLFNMSIVVRMHVQNVHSYTHLIPDLGIV